jgi:ketosteroid isomerase-like protein
MVTVSSMTELISRTTLFQGAVEARDHDLISASLAPDVVFHSPIPSRPFRGREVVASILRSPAAVFAFDDSFRYTTVMRDGDEHALFFQAEIDGEPFEGVDYIRTDGDGLVTELRVMARPLAQIQRFSERVDEILAALAATADTQ